MASGESELAIKRHFLDFLSTVYGQPHDDVEILSGGVVNHTVRARRLGRTGEGALGSIIIKYAPPFIAGLGPDAPFSQERQVRSRTEAAGRGNGITRVPRRSRPPRWGCSPMADP